MNLGKSFARQLLEFSVSVLVAAFLLSKAWTLVRPLLPVMAGVVFLVAVASFLHRRRGW